MESRYFCIVKTVRAEGTSWRTPNSKHSLKNYSAVFRDVGYSRNNYGLRLILIK
jgi:hypothetical protein